MHGASKLRKAAFCSVLHALRDATQRAGPQNMDTVREIKWLP